MFAAAILATLAATDETCSPMFETTPVLRYFNVRGRGEAIRLAFADNGIAFEDASFSGDDWGKDKEDGLKAKWTASGLIAFGQVPLLEIDGLKLVQSQAILRYLGRKVGWYAGDDAALTHIDIVADGVADAKSKVIAIKTDPTLTTDELKAAKFDEFFKGGVDGAKVWLGYLEKIVGASPTFFAAGTTRPTHADYLLFDCLDAYETVDAAKAAAVLATMPALSAWRSMMSERPLLKKYLEGPTRRK